jgi:hypothetical protein
MRADPWTDERIALLRTLWSGGATSQAIAERLGGVSRAAVLGKIFRLRVQAAASAPAALTRESNKKLDLKIDGAHEASLPRRRRGKRNASPATQNSPAAQKPSRACGKRLPELTNETCRWIVEAGIKWLVSAALSHLH